MYLAHSGKIIDHIYASDSSKVIELFVPNMSQLMRLWYLSHRLTAKAQARLGIRAISPEPSLFTHIKYGSR